jgi:multiple sugar transport system ATP-binding protein
MAEIQLEGVSKRFPDGTDAVRDVDLSIADGEFFILVGPSGCGKSTILNMIVGLEEPTEGVIRVGGRDVLGLDPKDRNMAMVFQSYAIYPHMTVRENMAFPLKLAKVGPGEVEARVERAAGILELGELLDRKPGALSGGQRQRVAMGRAIVREPSAFLLDEPLSNLDAKLRAQMRTEIGRLQRRLGTTTVYVTHDQAEAMTLGDHIGVLRRGRLQQVGTPRELYRRPVNLFVAGFIGSPAMNFLPARIQEGKLSLPMTEIPLPEELREGEGGERGEYIAGIRPESFRPAEPGAESGAEGAFHLPVELLEWMGADLFVYMKVDLAADGGLEDASTRLRGLFQELELEAPGEGSRRLVARLESGREASEGEPVSLRVAPEDVLLFDPDTGRRLTPEASGPPASPGS